MWGTHVAVKTVVKWPNRPRPAKNPKSSDFGLFFVELRGLEPLTPTLPGTGRAAEQAVQAHFWAVVGVVGVVTVVRVVVKIVVR